LRFLSDKQARLHLQLEALIHSADVFAVSDEEPSFTMFGVALSEQLEVGVMRRRWRRCRCTHHCP
jgi:hypothetical protein